uniref:Uncharacterized protein n=1 Tax=Avena sativa TaxID=4498 RepID=A0ACD5WBR7_AVESA
MTVPLLFNCGGALVAVAPAARSADTLKPAPHVSLLLAVGVLESVSFLSLGVRAPPRDYQRHPKHQSLYCLPPPHSIKHKAQPALQPHGGESPRRRMRGIRSRILRTLQSAAAHSNALLPAGGARPPTTEKCSVLQERVPSPLPAGAEAAPDPPTVSDCGDGGGDGDADKENRSPEANPRKAKKMKVSADDGASAEAYRRPELESVTLFDPDLLAAFRGVVDAYYAQALENTAKRHRADDEDDDILAALEDRGVDPLAGLEALCPPGGERAVVLYTTSLRGVRKTFEDCATVRRLLDGLRVAFLERDVSMHAPYRDELRALLLRRHAGDGDAMPLLPPPRLFVDGRYVGGADEVVALHERSRLRPMLRRAARRGAGEAACAVCGGAWFVVCGGCSGRHWLFDGGGAAAVAASRVPCPGCNENGLVPCPLCS